MIRQGIVQESALIPVLADNCHLCQQRLRMGLLHLQGLFAERGGKYHRIDTMASVLIGDVDENHDH